MQIIMIANKFYSKNKHTLNEIYLILLKTQSKLQYYVCYALKYTFCFNNFCFDILFSTTLRVAFYAKVGTFMKTLTALLVMFGNKECLRKQ
jgi:hypothetical protein